MSKLIKKEYSKSLIEGANAYQILEIFLENKGIYLDSIKSQLPLEDRNKL